MQTLGLPVIYLGLSVAIQCVAWFGEKGGEYARKGIQADRFKLSDCKGAAKG